MIVTSIEDVIGTERDVTAENGTWTSRRIVVAGHNVGFSLHDTRVAAGSVNRFRYTHHVEAVHIVEGSGSVKDLATGVIHPLKPGTMYLLDDHDEHVLTAHTDLRAICVFTPAVIGTERHDSSGAFPSNT